MWLRILPLNHTNVELKCADAMPLLFTLEALNHTNVELKFLRPRGTWTSGSTLNHTNVELKCRQVIIM